jgi:hypothetical protein
MAAKNNQATVGSALPASAKDAFKDAEAFYKTDLQALNGSGVSGEVLLAYDADTQQLTVLVSADGLEANQIHIQHIHGFADDGDPSTPRVDAQIPTMEDDADGDGFIELLEGVPDYGGILLNASLDHADGTGSDNGHSHDAGGLSGFPTAPRGTVRFAESYQLPTEEGLAAGTDFSLYHFVIHGMSTSGVGAGTGGEVDGTAGYKLVLPVAIGDFEEISRPEAMRELGAARREFAQDRAAARREEAQGEQDVHGGGFTSSVNADWLLA